MKLFNKTSRCIHRQDIKHHPNCFNSDGTPKTYKETSAKVLIFDIETLPIVAYSWGVWNQNISMSQIIKDWCVLSWSAKWLHDDKIISDVLSSREAATRNDKRLVSSLWKLLDDANIVIVQNGKKFDIRKLNTRFWKHQLPPTSSYKVIDTYTSARSIFGLTFNKQDFMAQFIGSQEKLDTDFELWAACDRGEPEALKYMLDYNENDVRGLEEIYLRMKEWIPNHPDLRLYLNVDGCPVCLNGNYSSIGFYTAKTKKYKEFRCDSCGAVWHSSKCEKE